MRDDFVRLDICDSIDKRERHARTENRASASALTETVLDVSVVGDTNKGIDRGLASAVYV